MPGPRSLKLATAGLVAMVTNDGFVFYMTPNKDLAAAIDYMEPISDLSLPWMAIWHPRVTAVPPGDRPTVARFVWASRAAGTGTYRYYRLFSTALSF